MSETTDRLLMEKRPGSSVQFPKHDHRQAKGLWAPGVYMNVCRKCGDHYIGDKRAFYCADCAYSTNKFPTGQQLANVLQTFGIIDAAAVDDPEGFDNYATLEAVNAAAKAMREMDQK